MMTFSPLLFLPACPLLPNSRISISSYSPHLLDIPLCIKPFRNQCLTKAQLPSPATPSPPSAIISPSTSLSNPSTSIPNVSPLLTFFSSLVGFLVLGGSILYKLPQVLRLVRSRRATGISPLSLVLETLSTTLSFLYYLRKRFPFSTYGEAVFGSLQNVILLLLVARLQKLPVVPCVILFLSYITLLAVTLGWKGLVGIRMLMWWQLVSIPLGNFAKIPQIWLNWRRQGTGELSPVTLGLQLAGNVARVFTTLVRVRDPLMFASTIVSTMFNTFLFAQWWGYNRSKIIVKRAHKA